MRSIISMIRNEATITSVKHIDVKDKKKLFVVNQDYFIRLPEAG